MVVSSVTPRMFLAISEYQPGFVFSRFLMAANRTSSSSLVALSRKAVSPFSARSPEMDEEGGVAAVVEDHVRRAAVGPLEDVVGVLPIVLEALALEGEHRDAGGGDRGRCVVLRRVDVAGGPADIGAERCSVSISTAVWMVMCSEPAMRAPLSGFFAAYSSRTAMRPGISVSAMSISLRPHEARPMSLTW